MPVRNKKIEMVRFVFFFSKKIIRRKIDSKTFEILICSFVYIFATVESIFSRNQILSFLFESEFGVEIKFVHSSINTSYNNLYDFVLYS